MIAFAPQSATKTAPKPATASRRLRRVALALAVAALAAGCSPIVHVHGYTPRAAELETVKAGVDTRDSVLRKLGRPSTIGSFDAKEWFYISLRSETYAFYEPEVTEQRVVLVEFDDAGMVREVGRYGLEDGRVIDLVTRTTPSSGRKLTILQQIFQNLGKYRSGRDLLRSVNSPR